MTERRELPRCGRCHKHLGPRDVVCGHCGYADLERIKERADALDLAFSCGHHYFVESSMGPRCVVCGKSARMDENRIAAPLKTRSRRVCLCCGSRLDGTQYCTTCGASVRRRSLFKALKAAPIELSRPLPRDKHLFWLMGQHANHMERLDPHFQFRIYSPHWQQVLLQVLVYLAIVAVVLIPVYMSNYYAGWKQKALHQSDMTNPITPTASAVAALDAYVRSGYDDGVIPDSVLRQQLKAAEDARAEEILSGKGNTAWGLSAESYQKILAAYNGRTTYQSLRFSFPAAFDYIVRQPVDQVLHMRNAPYLADQQVHASNKQRHDIMWSKMWPFYLSIPIALLLAAIALTVLRKGPDALYALSGKKKDHKLSTVRDKYGEHPWLQPRRARVLGTVSMVVAVEIGFYALCYVAYPLMIPSFLHWPPFRFGVYFYKEQIPFFVIAIALAVVTALLIRHAVKRYAAQPTREELVRP